MLLKAVSATGAHIPRHGETTKKFDEALQLFFDAAEEVRRVVGGKPERRSHICSKNHNEERP